MRKSIVNLLLVLGVIVVFVIALSVGISRGEFGGADASAVDEVAEVNADYEPWFEPFWTQPGGEVESGLFALQAGIGAGIVGFALGAYRERRNHRRETASSAPQPGADRA